MSAFYFWLGFYLGALFVAVGSMIKGEPSPAFLLAIIGANLMTLLLGLWISKRRER